MRQGRSGAAKARTTKWLGWWLRSMLLVLSLAAVPAWGQVTIPEEYGKNIQHRSKLGELGDGLAGDRIDLATGRLEIVQVDVDLPGNTALPVRVARRFEAADAYGGGHFRYWSLDIPNIHGTFPAIPNGWKVGANSDLRCSGYDAPPSITYQGATFEPNEYWHGTFLHLPGSGDQELLQNPGGAHVPNDGKTYPVVTKEGAVARCNVGLANTSEDGNSGEWFEVVTPDGVIYTFNHMVSRYQPSLKKSSPGPLQVTDGDDAQTDSTDVDAQSPSTGEQMQAATYILPRREYFLFPTKVADRFGNTVDYTWNSGNPWQLLSIAASDGRRLDFSYQNDRVASVTDGTRTWYYAYSAKTGSNDTADTLTLPDGTVWSFKLARLYHMPLGMSGADCGGVNGSTGRTIFTSTSGSGDYTGSITAPSGATVTYSMSSIPLGRSHTLYNCVSDGDDPLQAAPRDHYLFLSAAVIDKTITGPGLPSAGLVWNYSYGPTNNCWDGDNQGNGIQCTEASPATRMVLVTDPSGAVTRYTFGNQANVDEGLLYKTEMGWNGGSALRTTELAYGAPNAQPYAPHAGWSPRGHGDYAMTSMVRPQRRVTTTQQGRTFTWEVATGCNGYPYCFDAFARPTKVVKTSSP